MLKQYITKYVKENFKIIQILSFILLLGMISGIVVFSFLSNDIKNEFVSTIKSNLDIAKTTNFEGINIIKNGISSNLYLSLAIYFMAITLIAPILVILVVALKGFSIGVFISSIISLFGIGKGILVVLVLVLLPNIIYIPSFIYLCVNSINFHYMIMEDKDKIKSFGKESYKYILVMSLFVLSLIIEQLTSYLVINMYI